jgi:predicted GNAT family N-acyltransferase
MKIKLVSYAASEGDIRHIRNTVFGQEQQIPRELDWDGNDPACLHVVATDSKGNTIGTGRILADGKIGRLAVLKRWRSQGVGARMLEALVDFARSRDLGKVYLHAQAHAVPYYEKSGFKKEGDEFIEAGIRHIKMVRRVQPTLER